MAHCRLNLYVQKISLMVCLIYKAMIFCVWSRAIFCTIFLQLFMTSAANLASCAYARTPGIHCTGIQRLGWIVNPSNETVSNVTKHVHTVLLDPKWTKLVANFAEVEQISGVCDGQHRHAPWGYEFKNGKRVFATALEVHYPTALCDEIAPTLFIALQRRGITATKQVPINLAARTLAQNQPATNKIAPIVREYKSKCIAIFFLDQCVWPSSHGFVKHAKVLQQVEMGCESLQSLVDCVREQCRMWCMA